MKKSLVAIFIGLLTIVLFGSRVNAQSNTVMVSINTIYGENQVAPNILVTCVANDIQYSFVTDAEGIYNINLDTGYVIDCKTDVTQIGGGLWYGHVVTEIDENNTSININMYRVEMNAPPPSIILYLLYFPIINQ